MNLTATATDIDTAFVAIVGELSKDEEVRTIAAFGSAELASYDIDA